MENELLKNEYNQLKNDLNIIKKNYEKLLKFFLEDVFPKLIFSIKFNKQKVLKNLNENLFFKIFDKNQIKKFNNNIQNIKTIINNNSLINSKFYNNKILIKNFNSKSIEYKKGNLLKENNYFEKNNSTNYKLTLDNESNKLYDIYPIKKLNFDLGNISLKNSNCSKNFKESLVFKRKKVYTNNNRKRNIYNYKILYKQN